MIYFICSVAIATAASLLFFHLGKTVGLSQGYTEGLAIAKFTGDLSVPREIIKEVKDDCVVLRRAQDVLYKRE